ncbi:DUF6773 family protein [uncultured Gemmiger sp.]|uniref:DUF6773 family protein n=1 Tax=uncultured Gemmiger sp. TaxID=1623490 RepID=UPI0026653FD0|nr:DUF6773 family protein [uncultured Gemmiger sp.]
MKLDFYTRHSQLDEMQEQKLCKLESRGFWLLWWGLLAAIIVQSLAGQTTQAPTGEWVLFMLASLYMVVECIRNGIWDRHVKPNLCANILGSTVAGIAVFAWFYLKGRYWPGALCAGLCSALLCFAVLQFTAWLYHLRHNQLEHSEESEDEQ